MPLDRRRQLLARAAAEDFLIIEDDYDFEMSYLAPPAPALKSLDRAGRVIYIGSFSKALFPGLRIGYMVAPAPLIARARDLRAIMLRHPPAHLQRITAYFLAQGHYDAHIVRLRQALKARRQVLEEAISRTSLVIAGAAASGGSSVWIRGAPDVDSADLARRLRAESVLIEPGHVFFETPPEPCPFFRLGYCSITDGRSPRASARIDRMTRAWRSRRLSQADRQQPPGQVATIALATSIAPSLAPAPPRASWCPRWPGKPMPWHSQYRQVAQRHAVGQAQPQHMAANQLNSVIPSGLPVMNPASTAVVGIESAELTPVMNSPKAHSHQQQRQMACS
ncbi:aminotransferase-like domain-containing protein [Paracoccus mutanolyticus]|uniref:aminotransferase-like domain-containing protein n=1 Tax=Paracoccus mutanolyticus TaxID=1499308 RepID=UPI0021D534FD|nr:PLP-dependent aminotransferase family protein [Paracoccus mutanolyticus]